ncbi:hypothetical protein Dimus_000526 [Dionaea muscipula]
MADYQHVIAFHADVDHRKKRSWTDVEGPIEKEDLAHVGQENIMILLPQVFSPKDLPENVM